jgi:hypothetical protein
MRTRVVRPDASGSAVAGRSMDVLASRLLAAARAEATAP